MKRPIVCFGELLIRLSAPGSERLLQSPRLHVAIGGAEANVAVNLARFGDEAKMLTTIADNELGAAAQSELRKHGVDVSHVAKAAGRMGLYFLSPGAVSRPSQVLYDRADSAFATSVSLDADLDAVLDQAAFVHVSGITPAIGARAAQAAMTLVDAAVARGIKVSFDGNYRAQLWAKWAGDGPKILSHILACAHVAFINERDLELVLNQSLTDRQAAFAHAFEAFPRLEWIAATARALTSVNDQALSGELESRTGRWTTKAFPLVGIVDRIGTGDAFAAGLLHGLLAGHDPQTMIDFAVGSAVIKHSILGDFNLTTLAEVSQLLADGNLDVRR